MDGLCASVPLYQPKIKSSSRKSNLNFHVKKLIKYYVPSILFEAPKEISTRTLNPPSAHFKMVTFETQKESFSGIE